MERDPSSPPAHRPRVTEDRLWSILWANETVAAGQQGAQIAYNPSEMRVYSRVDAGLFLLISAIYRSGTRLQRSLSSTNSQNRWVEPFAGTSQVVAASSNYEVCERADLGITQASVLGQT